MTYAVSFQRASNHAPSPYLIGSPIMMSSEPAVGQSLSHTISAHSTINSTILNTIATFFDIAFSFICFLLRFADMCPEKLCSVSVYTPQYVLPELCCDYLAPQP